MTVHTDVECGRPHSGGVRPRWTQCGRGGGKKSSFCVDVINGWPLITSLYHFIYCTIKRGFALYISVLLVSACEEQLELIYSAGAEALTRAIKHTGETYDDIGQLYADQVKFCNFSILISVECVFWSFQLIW